VRSYTDNCHSEDETGHWLSYGVLWTTVHDLGNGSVERDNFAMDFSDYGLHLDDPVDAKQRRVVRMAASYREHHPFVIEESGEGALAFTVDDEKSPFYLALHKSCDQLAEKFINSATDVHDTFDIGSEDKATSFKQLWTVLFSRMPGAPGIEFALPHPQEYYGVECVQTSEWEPEDRNPEMGEVRTRAHLITLALLTIVFSLSKQTLSMFPHSPRRSWRIS
jgi:hypothetical protein